jgi:aminopeptidase N
MTARRKEGNTGARVTPPHRCFLLPFSPVSLHSRFLLTFLFLILSGFARTTPIHAQDFGRRERHVDVLHYRIEVRLDESARRVDGVTDITLTPLRTMVDSVVLDAVELHIDRVLLMGVDGDTTALPFRVDAAHLVITPPAPFAYGRRYTLRVVSSCTPRRGLYFIGPDASFPDDPRQIWTQGQGEDNRHWFPCYDFPNDKATSEVVMTIDTALRAVSNGVLRARHDNGDGTATWHWAQEQPHCSYLVMLAAGRYGVFRDERLGVPIESWHSLTDDTADVRRTYGDTGDMLVFFSEYTGTPYPWAKYVQVPVRHFLYGGMENTSATVLADTRVVVDARAALDEDPQPLIAHELAHQWFGDDVTYIDWTHEWLNEGFATFFQQRWTAKRNGLDDMIIQRANGIRNYIDWSGRAGRIPIVGTQRGGAHNTYAKGAAVLHMLHDMLGDEEFRRVIRAWLARHARGSVDTQDFIRVIEDVTGRTMTWFFKQWIYGAGYPEIRVTRESFGDSLRLTLTQVQETDSLCAYFRLPLTLRWPSGRTARIWIDGAETRVTLPIPREEPRDDAAGVLEFDPENVLCARIAVDYDTEESLTLLRSAASPIQRIDAAAALIETVGDDRVRRALLVAAEHDRHRAVRKAIATRLAELRDTRSDLAADLRALFLRLLEDPASGVRATAVNGLNNFRDHALLPRFHAMLADSSYYVEAAAMNAMLTVDSVGSRDVVAARLAKRSHGDVLALAALDWVRRYRMVEFLPAVRRLAAPGNEIVPRIRAMETLIVVGEAPDVLHATLRAWLDEPRAEIRAWAVSALVIFGPDEARRMLGDRIATERDPRVRAAMHALRGTTDSN